MKQQHSPPVGFRLGGPRKGELSARDRLLAFLRSLPVIETLPDGSIIVETRYPDASAAVPLHPVNTYRLFKRLRQEGMLTIVDFNPYVHPPTYRYQVSPGA